MRKREILEMIIAVFNWSMVLFKAMIEFYQFCCYCGKVNRLSSSSSSSDSLEHIWILDTQGVEQVDFYAWIINDLRAGISPCELYAWNAIFYLIKKFFSRQEK